MKTLLPILLLAAVCHAQQVGFDFRATSSFVTDSPGNVAVLPTTQYPTTASGFTFGWTNLGLVQQRDRSTSVDPRLAGINFAINGSPATFQVDLAPGTYSVALAIGDAGNQQCPCEVRLMDGTTVLADIKTQPTALGYFADATGNNWSAATWPSSNIITTVTLAGTHLGVVLGSDAPTLGNIYSVLAFVGIAPSVSAPSMFLSALQIKQGGQAVIPLNVTANNGFTGTVTFSTIGPLPTGVTVSYGAASATVNVGQNAPIGTYSFIIQGTSGNIVSAATVSLTVTQ